MDQNQTSSVDNDLQKAIDDITNNTNGDPVFADPVAAPSSIPEGDSGKLDEPVGPFPEPKPEIPPAPEPPMPESLPTPPEEPTFATEPNLAVPAPTPEVAPEPMLAPEPEPQSLSIEELKKAALRDLTPLLDKINMDPSQKFKIYCNIFEDLKDYTTLEPAYKAAREIPNETERAEALLYLVESIDKM